jgi:multiple sugar transport system permease protein
MNQTAGPVTNAMKLLFTLLYGVPLLWIVLTSLKSPADVFAQQTSLLFTPETTAYREAFDSTLFVALQQSVTIAVGTTVLTLTIAIPAAYGLARTSGWFTSSWLGLLIVLQMLPQTANIIPIFGIFGSWGLLDRTVGVVIADTALLLPFAVILLRPFFRAIPPEMEEAASIDGASSLATLFRIALPLARNGVATTGTLVFLLSWGEFLYAVNLFLSPGSYPLSVLLAQQVSAFGINWPGLMALAVLTSIPVLVIYAISYRLLRDGLTVGAVK